MSDERRLGPGAIALLFTIAACVDGLQFLADLVLIGILLEPFLSFIANGGIWLVLQHHNIKMFGRRRTVGTILTLISEYLPGADGFIPGWIAYVIYIVTTNRINTRGKSIMN
jgi:hypothetical protein